LENVKQVMYLKQEVYGIQFKASRSRPIFY